MAIQAKPHEFDEDFINESDRLLAHNRALRDNLQVVAAIKDSIAAEDFELAFEMWSSLPETLQEELWVAPTKGGIFTTREREIMKLDKFEVKEQENG